jgi:hypothetical protein
MLARHALTDAGRSLALEPRMSSVLSTASSRCAPLTTNLTFSLGRVTIHQLELTGYSRIVDLRLFVGLIALFPFLFRSPVARSRLSSALSKT